MSAGLIGSPADSASRQLVAFLGAVSRFDSEQGAPERRRRAGGARLRRRRGRDHRVAGRARDIRHGAAIAHAIVGLGSNLKMSVIAEGIDSHQR